MFDSGISYVGDLLDLAVEHGVVDKSGAWFSFDKVRLGQGREGARAFLQENADLCAEIAAALKTKMATAPDVAPKKDAEDEEEE